MCLTHRTKTTVFQKRAKYWCLKYVVCSLLYNVLLHVIVIVSIFVLFICPVGVIRLVSGTMEDDDDFDLDFPDDIQKENASPGKKSSQFLSRSVTSSFQ